MSLANKNGLHYVVDIDIKGFFDNVNHAKLLKQLWTMGIRDKNLLCIISKMLKAEIKGVGFPEKGVPQGGILSPLLSNVVLNELDWWIASQWESFPSRKMYAGNDKKYRALKDTRLKEVFIVRYADDFKLFCRSFETAQKIFTATKDWLMKRLGLEISPEKSKIVNLKKQYSEFLGFKLKLMGKGKKLVIKSGLTDKSIHKCKEKIKERIKEIQKSPSVNNATLFNSTVLGLHNYYCVATRVNLDFHRIAFDVKKNLKNRLRRAKNKRGTKSKAFEKFYGHYGGKITYIQEVALFPIDAIKTKPPMCFSQNICNYTWEGRKLIHDKLQSIDMSILQYLMDNAIGSRSAEFNDNRISLYVGQQGKCFVTGEKLEVSNMEVHHKNAVANGGSDEYKNLVFVLFDVHKLIHTTEPETIEKYLNNLGRNAIDFKRLNKLRVLVGNCELCENK